MGNIIRDVMRYVEHMDAQEWVVFGAIGMLIGILCMRGLGTKSNF